MTLIEFGTICGFWLFIYIVVKIVSWITHVNKGKKQMISFKLQNLKKEICKFCEYLKKLEVIKCSVALKGLKKIQCKCTKVEKRFNIYMFDNPDNKTIDNAFRKFVNSKSVYSESIAELFFDEEKEELNAEDIKIVVKDLEKLYNLCEELDQKIVEEVERTNKREAFSF